MDINGASAIVTGGAGGLGAAAVKQLVAAGAQVGILDLDQDRGEALASELDGKARFIRTDVTSEENVVDSISTAAEAGPLRVAVICHGGPGRGGRTIGPDGTPHSLDAFKGTIDAYLVGTFNVLRLSASQMSKSEPFDGGERGCIITTASIAGMEGTIGQIAYGAAKGGVIAMAIVAARDLGAVGVRCVCIAPGTFLTPAYQAPAEELEAAWGPVIPFPKRMGQPAEYAQLCQSIWENPYLNGTVIRIDGGLRFTQKGNRL